MRVVQKAPAIGKSTYIIMIPAPEVAKREGNRLTVEGFDLKACLDFCVARGFYKPTDYLLTIQAGWESRVLHGFLRSDDLKLAVGRQGTEPVRLPLGLARSRDSGKSWGREMVIRDGCASPGNDADPGYPRAEQRADGQAMVFYYWAGPERRQMHIPATLWTP